MAHQQTVPTNQFSRAKPHRPFEELKSPLQELKSSLKILFLFFSLGSKMDIKNILRIVFFFRFRKMLFILSIGFSPIPEDAFWG